MSTSSGQKSNPIVLYSNNLFCQVQPKTVCYRQQECLAILTMRAFHNIRSNKWVHATYMPPRMPPTYVARSTRHWLSNHQPLAPKLQMILASFLSSHTKAPNPALSLGQSHTTIKGRRRRPDPSVKSLHANSAFKVLFVLKVELLPKSKVEKVREDLFFE